jgi:hypothetical protein
MVWRSTVPRALTFAVIVLEAVILIAVAVR